MNHPGQIVSVLPRPLGVTTSPARNHLAALQAQVFREHRDRRPAQTLMPWVLDRRNLEGARERVLAADGAATPGVDGMTGAEVRQRGARFLAELADEILQRKYKPSAPRWLEIPKPDKPGKVRRLGILTLRDRVVLTAIKQVLEPILEPGFAPLSYGFRPRRSVSLALLEACRLLTGTADASSFPWAAHVDVANCFDTIDIDHLRGELVKHLADADLLRLLEALLSVGATKVKGWFSSRLCGVVQGSALSPLLCNLALHPLDALVIEEMSESACMLRYADDLLVLGKDARAVSQTISLITRGLGRMHQTLREPISKPTLAAQGVDWLGVTLRPRDRPWSARVEFGYRVPAAKVTSMVQRITEMTVPPNERIAPDAFNVGRWIVSINEQLRDWRGAYLFAENAPEVFRSLDEHTRERVAELLHCLTGKRRGTLVRDYRRRLARGFWTWDVNGVQLTVLSSLAPHAPDPRLRPPEWMTYKLSPQESAGPAHGVQAPAVTEVDADTGE